MAAVLRVVSFTLGDTLEIDRERHAVALQALRDAGATDTELGDALTGVSVVNGEWRRVIACYVAEPRSARSTSTDV